MAVQSYKMGPGTLTLGTGPLDASAQVTKCRVTPSETVKSTDAVKVLSGDELAAQESASLTWKLTATFVQDIAAAGLVDFTWTNAGDEVPFSFVPSTAAGREVSGTVRIVPIEVGGDVDARNTADVSWSIIGTPTLGAAA